MKALTLVGLLTAGALGLSACGAPATVDQAVTSLGASPYLQLHVTGSLSSANPDLTKAAYQVKNLSLTLDFASTNGASLSSAGSSVNGEARLAVSGTTVADVRAIGTNLYVKLDPTRLDALPGANVPVGVLAGASQMLGGRWFEIPQSLIARFTAAHQPSAAQLARAQALARAAIAALATLVETAPSTSSNGTFTETGTLQSIADALAPVLGAATGATPTVAGTYSISLTTSGTTATGGSITITSPSPSALGPSSPVTVSLDATAGHDSLPVVAPANAIVVTPSMLSQLAAIAG
ncbi:MAG TPA: hypothetical protein VFN59_06660 [Acidimicrobiales bacterium]|nr:hypothetical protein [Acidimicrobiales bacterium]